MAPGRQLCSQAFVGQPSPRWSLSIQWQLSYNSMQTTWKAPGAAIQRARDTWQNRLTSYRNGFTGRLIFNTV
jgi:hypothetical protein